MCGHAVYQERVLDQLRNYYPDAASSLPSSTWEIIGKFWNLDLSEIDLIMKDRYSSFRHAPFHPSLRRSQGLFLIPGGLLTSKRTLSMPSSPAFPSASVGDTPGVGTFYDFQRRLWFSDKKDLSDPLRPPRVKPQKPDRKGEKAPSVEKVSVADLFKKFETDPPRDMDPCRLIWQIFQELFLSRSISDGLIDPENLSLAGDGTPIRTAARERKKRTCDCLEKGIRSCSCDRLYSQPDCK